MNDRFSPANYCYLNLAYVFWQQKAVILATTLIVTLFFGVCIYTHKVKYYASVWLGPPRAVNASSLSTPALKSWDNLKLYGLFSHSIHSASVWSLFYKKIYAPYELILVERSLGAQEKYYLSFTHDNPLDVVTCLKTFIFTVNKSANQYLALIIAQQKIAELLEYKIMKSGLSVIDIGFESVVTSSLVTAQQLSFMRLVDLFQYDSPIDLSNTMLESKLKVTLILGILGGLILGFFVATLRISYAHKY